MRTLLLVLLVSGCGGSGLGSSSSSKDMGGQPVSDDLATTSPASDLAIAPADLAHRPYDFAQPTVSQDLAMQSTQPPTPDLAPACSIVPACSPTRLPNGTFCCNGMGCTNGGCFALAGEPCSYVTGPVCWDDGLGGSTSNGVCGTNGRCE